MSRPAAPPKLQCRQHPVPIVALGNAINLLRTATPFSTYRFGVFSSVLWGQIVRKHYVFTLSGRQLVGYFGWALCDEKVARAWVEEDYVPTHEECLDGDCFVGATFYAKTREVTFFQIRHVRRLYPNVKAFGRRDYGELPGPMGGRLRPMNTFNIVKEGDDQP